MAYRGDSAGTRRSPVGLALVAGLHVIFVWALISGLKIHSVFTPPDVIVGRVLPTDPPRVPEAPAPRDPTRAVTVTLPEQPDPLRVPEDPLVITDPTPLAATVTDGSFGSAEAPHQPVLSDPALDPRWPLTQPPYPPAAIRANAEGSLMLQVLVGADGHVRDARVSRGSGFDLLDRAAVDEARKHWRLRPATRDGTPVEQWYTLRVVFHLEKR